MVTNSSDPREIEADLERERAALASTLDTLSDRVSVDGLAKEALGVLKSHAGSATTRLDHAVRANPVAVALVGAGLAWMFFGPRVTRAVASHDYGSGYGDAASSPKALSTGYAPASYPATGSYASGTYAGTDARGYASSGDDHAWSADAQGLRARAAEALHRIEEEAKSYYDSLRRGIASGTEGARDFAAEKASVVSGFASDLKARFAAGLDNLTPEARDRIVAAREQAYGAMLKAERMGRDAWRDPQATLEDHPLAVGSIGFAIGALAGALLPSTEVENRTLGAERDRMMDDAARLFRQERERAVAIAGNLGSEVKAAAMETAEAVADTVSAKASQAANRVGARAEDGLRDLKTDGPVVG